MGLLDKCCGHPVCESCGHPKASADADCLECVAGRAHAKKRKNQARKAAKRALKEKHGKKYIPEPDERLDAVVSESTYSRSSVTGIFISSVTGK
jgi:hypothetical protein